MHPRQVLQNQNVSSIGSYLDYCEVCIQRKLSLLAILTPNVAVGRYIEMEEVQCLQPLLAD